MIKETKPNCGKCGLCLSVCPVYQQMREEHASPRARMQLIKSHKEQTLSSSPYLKDIMSKCLMCGSCTANCPSGINHYEAFIKMREQMVADHGEAPSIKSLIYLLAKDFRTRIGAGIAKTGQKVLPDAVAKQYNIGNIPIKNMPQLNKTPFRKACGNHHLPKGPAKGVVAYFTGCATQYMYDDTGFAAVNLLTTLGYEVIIPDTQTCCSIPLLFHGAAKKAETNITANIDALKNINADHILVDCSTCGEALKKIYPGFFDSDHPLAKEAAAISEKVTDLLSFIHKHIDDLPFEEKGEDKPVVTYHAPCHSKNSKWGHAENLIESLPFVVYKKTADTEACCGGGGTFFYEYPEVSRKMMDEKIKHAKAVKASLWLTDCPVCRMNISGNLQEKDRIKVSHPLTLINSALKKI